MCLEVCTSGRSYEAKLIGLLHRMSGGVFQAAVSLLCPGVGSQLGAVSPSVTVLQDPLATRATCLRGVPWWQPGPFQYRLARTRRQPNSSLPRAGTGHPGLGALPSERPEKPKEIKVAVY